MSIFLILIICLLYFNSSKEAQVKMKPIFTVVGIVFGSILALELAIYGCVVAFVLLVAHAGYNDPSLKHEAQRQTISKDVGNQIEPGHGFSTGSAHPKR